MLLEGWRTMAIIAQVGKTLQALQDRISRNYPTGTKVVIVEVVAEITEPGQAMREVTFNAPKKRPERL
jgi:hypothetical protein